MNLKIELLPGTYSPDELKELTESEAFNAPFVQYRNDAYNLCTKDLTESEKAEFDIWDKGKLPQGFWDTVSKNAHSAILSFIGWGCG